MGKKLKSRSQGALNKRALDVVKACDVILEVLDARFPRETRNRDLEQSVIRTGKKLILVLNKADLADKKNVKEFIEGGGLHAVHTSCKEFTGLSNLKSMLQRIARESGKDIRVGVVGQPNVGKSALINRLALRHATKVSPIAGTTVGEQWVRITSNIMLFDSPGVLQSSKRAPLMMTGGINPEDLQDPELAAVKIINLLRKSEPERLVKKYGLEFLEGEDEDVLARIALKMNRLAKGGAPDTKTMATMIVRAWQRGEL